MQPGEGGACLPATHPVPPPTQALHPAALQAKEKKERDAKNKEEEEAAKVGRLPPPLCSLGRVERVWGCLPPCALHPFNACRRLGTL